MRGAYVWAFVDVQRALREYVRFRVHGFHAANAGYVPYANLPNVLAFGAVDGADAGLAVVDVVGGGGGGVAVGAGLVSIILVAAATSESPAKEAAVMN